MDDGWPRTLTACAGCRERDARIAELEQRLADSVRRTTELERKLAEVTRESQRQTVKFPRRKLVPLTEQKPSGRKPGHDGAFRAIPKKVDRTIQVPCRTCPECRVALVGLQTRDIDQTDIPPVQPQSRSSR
jgi:uncharacterized coiled-coil protein SlyX